MFKIFKLVADWEEKLMYKMFKQVADWLLGGTGSLDRLVEAMSTGGEKN